MQSQSVIKVPLEEDVEMEVQCIQLLGLSVFLLICVCSACLQTCVFVCVRVCVFMCCYSVDFACIYCL